MNTTYIFFTSDSHKSTNSGSPLFIFADNHKQKVLNYIKSNIDDYFDGDKVHKKQQFKAFEALVEFKGSISQAINADLSLYARCEEIKPITQINN